MVVYICVTSVTVLTSMGTSLKKLFEVHVAERKQGQDLDEQNGSGDDDGDGNVGGRGDGDGDGGGSSDEGADDERTRLLKRADVKGGDGDEAKKHREIAEAFERAAEAHRHIAALLSK